MDNLRIDSAAVSDRGLSEKRPENQDSYLEMPERGVFAVADGVGGAQAGEVASQMAVEILAEAFANQGDRMDAEDTLRAAIERANSAIFQMANELPQLSSMATTIVALHLAGDIATIGHVGDSRLYRVDDDGNLHRDTEDHSMVGEEVRAGRMTAEQAETHPSRNIISRALGAEPSVQVDLKTIMIVPGTAFMLCSDGITRHVADEEIRGVLNFGGSPTDICNYLKGLCYERGAEDNLTAVVVKIGTAAVAAVGSPPSIVPPLVTEPTIDEESTIATVRPPFDGEAKEADLLDLETREMTKPDEIPVDVEMDTREPVEPPRSTPASPEPFSIFGETDLPAASSTESAGSIGSMATALGMLVLGSLIGLAAYHFVLVPESKPENLPLEMRSANIPLSAFEENRRNVDNDPVGYISKFAMAPEDAEDHYLLGRAYLLTGDYPKARGEFIESRNRLGEADPVNAKILASEIAMGMAVTNDTTIQTNLRRELEAAKQSVNTNANVSR